MRNKLMTVGAGVIVAALAGVGGVAGASGDTSDEPVSEKEFTDHCTENLDGTATVESDGNVSHMTCSWSDLDGNEYLNECWTETGPGGDVAHQNCSFPTEADPAPDHSWLPDGEVLDSQAPDVFAPEEEDEPVIGPDLDPAPDVGDFELPADEGAADDEDDAPSAPSLGPVQEDSFGPEDAAPGDDSGPSEFRPGSNRPEAVTEQSVASR